MQAIFYNYSKRINETKHPSSGGVVLNVNLKSPCDILKPVLELENYAPGNYVYLPSFKRYYFVSNQRFNFGIWEISLSVDVLASFLSDIRSASAQVLFSSSDYNLDLIDTRIPGSGRIIRNVTSQIFDGALGGQQAAPGGTFAVTALDDQGIWATGATTTYFLTYQQMQTFVSELINPTVWEELQQYFNNPMEAIIECYYLPLDISSYVSLSNPHSITIGDYTFPSAQARTALSTNMAVKSHSTDISLDWPYDDFRRMPPYTSIEVFVPFCGVTPISPESCYQLDRLLIDYSVDVTSGSVQAIIYAKETVLGEMTGNCKISLPLAQTQSRVNNIVGSIIGEAGALAGFASSNPALGATAVLSAVASAVAPTQHKIMGGMQGSVLGAILGNTAMTWQRFRCSITSHETESSPDSIRGIIGNVNGNVLALSGLSGYCQTYGASIATAEATDTELQMINSMLDAGIYFT